MGDWPERDLGKIAKGWSIAMKCSKDRLKRVYSLKDDQLEDAINEGRLVLETTCLFMHACVKHGQYQLPLEFWRVLHGEYGIVVYPSAFTEDIDVQGLGTDVTFTEAYYGHISEYSPSDILIGTNYPNGIIKAMFGRCGDAKCPPRCPFEFLQEPPPVYHK